MPANLPELIQQLLIANVLMERMKISDTIFKTLESIDDFGPVELVMKRQFISRIKVCAMYPEAQQCCLIIQMADFYAKNYTDFDCAFLFAA